MVIKKEYKFYAGHRNQELQDKCHRPHGHFYLLSVYFDVVRDGSISTLFSTFDDKVEPWLKNTLDHRFLVDINDTLYKTFKDHETKYNDNLGVLPIPFPTSVENISLYIFYQLSKVFEFEISKIELKETSSSTLIYSKEDFKNDMGTLLGLSL